MRALAPGFVVLACLAAAGCVEPSQSTGGGGTSGTSGTAGTTGTAGTGAPVMCGAETPAPAAGGANYPFPQHRLSASCGYPTNCNDADVMTSWTTYKGKMIVSGKAKETWIGFKEELIA